MYLSRNASKARLREAQNARNNRHEIQKALSQGQITRRDLFKWGLFTTTGALALKNGLSPFAKSAFAGDDIPTGTPPSPTFGAQPFTQPMPRMAEQKPMPLRRVPGVDADEAAFPDGLSQLNAARLSYHTDFTDSGGTEFINPVTNVGPLEGRPPGEFFAHQRWEEFFPVDGYLLSLGQVAPNTTFHPAFPAQNPNSVWTFGTGGLGTLGTFPPPLIKGRYGVPILARIYNSLPNDPAQNGGFGSIDQTTHFHNAHNGAESDGAANAQHYPGTFYDYHWVTTMARHDTINTQAGDPRASGPDGNGGLINVPGDFREIQGTMWFHDHRFFFTAENVYKGHMGMINYYSGPDRGNEELEDGVNLRLPSGRLLDFGNTDFDVNLLIADFALDQEGQYFFDIFDTDGFLGDLTHVNFAFKPFFEVLPRKYRFRILNACMSRFFKFAIADDRGRLVPFQFIANDGNLVVNPIQLQELDQQGVAERFDIVVDFSSFPQGERLWLVNTLQFKNGRRPDEELRVRSALANRSDDPAVGALLEFRLVNEVDSVDVPGVTLRASDSDVSQVPGQLTQQIPLVQPVRERVIRWTRGGADARENPGGVCIPDCGDRESFPWTVRVNGEGQHSLNANRISALVPRANEVEHWTFVNGGGGWDHPIHLHFEEGITINRGDAPIPATERLVRKDVWRLRAGGEVKIQVQFSEFGGAYVTHCHNTVHEDAAMLMRLQLLRDDDGSGAPQIAVTPTPNPSPEGVVYTTPEILPEADPNFGRDDEVAEETARQRRRARRRRRNRG